MRSSNPARCRAPGVLLLVGGLMAAGPGLARDAQGPGSSQGPWVRGEAGERVVSVLTSGDQVAGMRVPGAPSGVAVLGGEGGRFTLFVSHDLGGAQGLSRAHGARGSFLSQWQVDRATLAPIAGADLINAVWAQVGGLWSALPAEPLRHLGAPDLPSAAAWWDVDSGLGTTSRLLLTGEGERNGQALAVVAQGLNQGRAFVLPWGARSEVSGQQVSWRVLRAHPAAGRQTLVMGLLGGDEGGLLLWVGNKQASGNAVERAGLTSGQVYRLTVPGQPRETRAHDAGLALAGRQVAFEAVGGSGDAFADRVAPATRWLQPADGAWDPLHPKDFYLVTQDRMDGAKEAGQDADTPVGQRGRSRLWRLSFHDLDRPDRGGTLTLLENGVPATGAYQRLAAVQVVQGGSVALAEDPGVDARPAALWRGRLNSDSGTTRLLQRHAQADVARFGDTATSGTQGRGEGFASLVDLDRDIGLPGGHRNCLLSALRDRQPNADPAVVEGGQVLLLCGR